MVYNIDPRVNVFFSAYFSFKSLAYRRSLNAVVAGISNGSHNIILRLFTAVNDELDGGNRCSRNHRYNGHRRCLQYFSTCTPANYRIISVLLFSVTASVVATPPCDVYAVHHLTARQKVVPRSHSRRRGRKCAATRTLCAIHGRDGRRCEIPKRIHSAGGSASSARARALFPRHTSPPAADSSSSPTRLRRCPRAVFARRFSADSFARPPPSPLAARVSDIAVLQ